MDRAFVETVTSAEPEDVEALPVPESYRAVVTLKEERSMFAGVPMENRTPSKALHLIDVPTPEPGHGEVLVASMASGVNYNTVWSALSEPVSSFVFLEQYGREGGLAARHDQPFHVVGSDLAGVVLRTGPGVRRWRVGQRVVAHTLSAELDHPQGHEDSVLDPEQRMWGYQTNYGGLGELALVKAHQLMPKPPHLTWEEAASAGVVNSTAFRQLVSRNGADMQQGDNVLIWGAAGGVGSYATQYALAGGAIPICVVSSPAKAEICRAMGAEAIIDRCAEDYQFWSDEHVQDPLEWRRFALRIKDLTGGEEPDIVFEHSGMETFGVSVYVVRRGGVVVTCASTSGYMHQYDNRYLWMNVKKIIGSHSANYNEAWKANRLLTMGRIHPTLSRTYPLADTGQAVDDVRANRHVGKVGVLCMATEEGGGVDAPEFRARHESAINRFRSR